MHSSLMNYVDSPDDVFSSKIKIFFRLSKRQLEVEKFLELKEMQSKLCLRVRVGGFEKDAESWEPLEVMHEEAPSIVSELTK